MKQRIIAAILIIILMAVWVQIYFIFKERNQLKSRLDGLTLKANSLTEENEKIKSEIEYFSLPENLEKELRAKFNYKKPGEKMIIVVP